MDRPAHVTVEMLCDAEDDGPIRPATKAELEESRAAVATHGVILVGRRLCHVRPGLMLASLATGAGA